MQGAISVRENLFGSVLYNSQPVLNSLGSNRTLRLLAALWSVLSAERCLGRLSADLYWDAGYTVTIVCIAGLNQPLPAMTAERFPILSKTVIVAVSLTARQQSVSCPPVAELLLKGATALKQAATNRQCGGTPTQLPAVNSKPRAQVSALRKRCCHFVEHLFPVGMRREWLNGA